jgi:hypothetical protein
MSEELTREEIHELAEVFGVSVSARLLLEDAGMSRGQIPAVAEGNAEHFWLQVSRLLANGLIDCGRWRVLTAALAEYRFNPVFQAGVVVAQRPPDAGPGRASQPQRQPPRPAMAPSASSAPPYGEALPFTIVALDARSYSKQTLPTHVDWRTAIRDIVMASARRCGIAAEAVTMQDTGDGVLAGFRPEVSKRLIVAEFVGRLRDEVRAYNRGRKASARLRLRAALHSGETVVHKTGFAGEAAIIAARLVDAPPTREVLESMGDVDLAVILSDRFYRDTVGNELHGLERSDYRRVKVDIPKFKGIGWLHVPGYGISSVPPTSPSSSGPPTPPGPAPPGPAPPGSAGESPPHSEPRTTGASSDTGAPPSPGTSSNPETSSNPGDESSGRAAGWDFLVSYAPQEQDKMWAEWIASTLEDKGYQVHIEVWDGVPGTNTVARIDSAVIRSRRTIVVLTPDYINAGKHQADWYAAWEKDPQGADRSLIPVRVENFAAPGLLNGIVPVDLFDLDVDAARDRLTQKIEQAIKGRAKPSGTPPFPGGRA